MSTNILKVLKFIEENGWIVVDKNMKSIKISDKEILVKWRQGSSKEKGIEAIKDKIFRV